jgi:O-antigen/teichoic acid export membrane protein
MTRFHAIDFKRLRRISQESAWVALGQVIAVIGALVGVRLLTELLDPASYGQLALGMTLATLVHQCIFGPLGHGATRFWSPAEEAKDLPGYLSAARGLIAKATGLVVALAVSGAGALWISGHVSWAVLTMLAAIFALLRGYNSILGGLQNAARQRIIVAFHQGAETWMRFLLAAAAIVLLAATSTAAMAGYVLAMLLVLVSQALFFRRRLVSVSMTSAGDPGWRDQIWQFAWPFAAFGLFTWAQVASARWALEMFASTEDVGFYAVLFQLGVYPMSILTAMAIQYLAPIFYQRAGDAQDALRNENVRVLGARLTSTTLSLTFVATAAVFLLHQWIFRWFVAENYRSVSYLLPWLVLAGGLIAAAQTVELNLMSMLKTRSMLRVKVVTAIAGVIFNYLGARYYGILGVVAANILFAVPYFLWMLYLRYRVAGSGLFNA